MRYESEEHLEETIKHIPHGKILQGTCSLTCIEAVARIAIRCNKIFSITVDNSCINLEQQCYARFTIHPMGGQ